MKITLEDRIVSILSYFTFGIFSIIWIIFANVTKRKISQYLNFNLYQAVFISIVLYIISLIYDIALNLMVKIPFVGKIVYNFDLFFNKTPLYFTFTLSGLIVTLLVIYLILMSLVGKKPYIPVVSDIIKSNFGE